MFPVIPRCSALGLVPLRCGVNWLHATVDHRHIRCQSPRIRPQARGRLPGASPEANGCMPGLPEDAPETRPGPDRQLGFVAVKQ